MASNEEDTLNPNMGHEEEDSGLLTSHKYETMFSLYETLGLEDHREQLDYKTWCNNSSSWEIVIQFEKELPFDNFNLFVTLRRTDCKPYVVEGILVIWFLNIEGKKCPVPYSVRCTINGKGVAYDVFAVDPHFNCLLREDRITVPEDVLVVKVQLFVKGCCANKIKDEPEIGKHLKKEDATRVLCCPRL